MFFKVVGKNATNRPITCQSEHDARRRLLAAMGLELEPISREEFNRLEAASRVTLGLPAISECCEPGEDPADNPHCDGDCPERHLCPLQVARRARTQSCVYCEKPLEDQDRHPAQKDTHLWCLEQRTKEANDAALYFGQVITGAIGEKA